MQHHFHQAIGRLIRDDLPDEQVVLDTACGGEGPVPLYRLAEGDKPGNANHYADADAVVTVDGRVRAIMEIEESNVRPVHICGKFLASALCTHYACGAEVVPMADGVLFIQVVDKSMLPEGKGSKIAQWERIASAIRSLLPLRGSNITQYDLFYVEGADYDKSQGEALKLRQRLQQIIG